MEIRPITQRRAQSFVNEHHRHLKAARGDVIRVGLFEADRLVGVGHAGRPTARLLDDGVTLEITRVAVLSDLVSVSDRRGTLHAAPGCTMIYAALRRAGRALGWRRVLTYTLPEEGGVSLRAAGFRAVHTTRGGEWDRPSRARGAADRADPKLRWEWP